MTTVSGWHHLEPFGIEPLTGEACGLMMRVLCDVSSKGQQILEKCLGVHGIELQPPWNSGRPDDPHVGSLLLAPGFFGPIAVFCLLELGHDAAYALTSGIVVGIEPTDSPELVEQWRLLHAGDIERRFTYAGTAGDRNIHQMSGRVV